MYDAMRCDVLVIGAGAAGIPAAVGAARAGAKVILVEDDANIGGAAIDQYVLMPDGGPRSGIGAELMARLAALHPLTPKPATLWWNHWYLPCDYLRAVMALVRAEDNLTLLCGLPVAAPLVETIGGRPRVCGGVLRRPDGRELRIQATVTIEATGTGDIAAQAGCATLYGRDAQRDFGERYAPEEPDDRVQMCTWQYISQRIGNGPPFRMEQLGSRPLESGYGWLSTDDEEAWKRNSGIYLHWGCKIRCPDTRDPLELTATQREALALLEPDIDCLRSHGYAVHLAPRLGVRESRRVLGDAVITFDDLIAGRIPEDSVLVTQRGVDIWKETGHTIAEYPDVRPYGIPYRALLPRGVDGLLIAGKHISGTHLAMGAYRVQCLLATVGQAAGVAAALATHQGCQPRDLPQQQLLQTLQAPPQNVILDPALCCPPLE